MKQPMNTTLAILKEQISQLRMEEMRLEAEDFRCRIKPALEASLGQTFVWRNNTDGSNRYWDKFRKATAYSFTEYHAFIVFEECEVRADGDASLRNYVDYVYPQRTDSKTGLPFLGEGWKECESVEYETVRASALAEIANPQLRLKHLAE